MPEVNFATGTVYASVSDVKKYFRNPESFGQNTNPSDEQVLEMIRRASTKIDEYTRHAWRANQVIEEMKSFDGPYGWDRGRPVVLTRSQVREPDTAQGDKIEVWDGSSWEDWVSQSSTTYGRDNDYWLDKNAGILYLYKRFVWPARPQIRVTYRYGKNVSTTSNSTGVGTSYDVIDTPHDIKEACEKLAAYDLLSSDQFTQLVPGGEGAPSPEATMQNWQRDVFGDQQRDGILDRHKQDPAWVEPV